nr:MAG TPA: hypothetical protein [Herelleviridae sp.]
MRYSRQDGRNRLTHLRKRKPRYQKSQMVPG